MVLPSISLVIPCYNEASRLHQLQDALQYFIATWRGIWQVIIINDGSTDDTSAWLSNNTFINQLVLDGRCIIINQNNMGKGGALATGVATATSEWVLTLDADMSTEPITLLHWLRLEPNLLSTNNKVYIASRALKQSQLNLKSNRRQKGKLFNTITRLCTGMPYTDTQCGFKLYPAQIALPLFAQLHTKGWAHDIEILLKLHKQNISIVELPVLWNEYMASSINVWRDGLKMIWDTFTISLRYRW
jgi:dolichyl-phosphate beta-glucosyltransferase